LLYERVSSVVLNPCESMTLIEQLRSEARRILARGDVKYVIGHTAGAHGCRTAPLFARTDADVAALVWSPLCAQNLATYVVLEARLPLPETQDDSGRKIAVIVKGCEARALVVQLQEHAIARDNVIIIGVPCQGMIDPQKLEARCGDLAGISAVSESADLYRIVSPHGSVDIPQDDLLADLCRNCQYPTPLIYDVLIEAPAKSPQADRYATIRQLETRTRDERWTTWSRHLARCIRCYACRNVCPICNCVECLVVSTQPTWIRRSTNLSENTAFHVMRAFHLAGRCVECGMCIRACPVRIPLTDLYQKVSKDAQELFGYTAGLDAAAPPLLSTYSVDDSDAGIL
jgi:formate dehydrogenase (coenzyme F420) beta subunit